METPRHLRFTALWLCAICIAVFILQQFIGTDYFILDNSLKWSQPWRIITSIFAHASAYHLLSNLFALALFGLILEGRIGPWRVLGLFMFSGIAINIFSPYSRSLGASGAIFALIGALVALRPFMVIWVDMLPMPMIIAGVVYLVQDVIGTFVPSSIANLAHIGGLFIGLAIGLFWRRDFGDSVHWKKKKRSDSILENRIDDWERKEGLR